MILPHYKALVMEELGESPAMCKRCQAEPQSLMLRGEAVCKYVGTVTTLPIKYRMNCVLTHPSSTCFARFISTKAVKRLESLQRSLGTPHSRTARYLLGLSFGTSSAALLHLLHENLRQRAERGKKGPYELVVVHIDNPLAVITPDPASASTTDQLLNGYRERYPQVDFQCVPLSSTLSLQTIDWSALPALPPDRPPADQLQTLLSDLPSQTSRTDLVRLFVRHLLISAARQHACQAVLYGSSTTALAELTLAETAKGRGFSLPWQVDDGTALYLRDYNSPAGSEGDGTSSAVSGEATGEPPIHYPFRDVFRRELVTFAALAGHSLTDLVVSPADRPGGGAVVSHRDVGVEEVVARFFTDVEVNYPSVVANVVRTTGKLSRLESSAGDACGLCGMARDELGDERWDGEIGDDGGGGGASGWGGLCYGCRRAISA